MKEQIKNENDDATTAGICFQTARERYGTLFSGRYVRQRQTTSSSSVDLEYQLYT